ncbi:acyl-CoA thioesterase [Paraglaciecola polaris]|uniref:Acyl-CoA thioester hydrolase n=1 Tax=Paraglaciecola polaris LMG 21857 TaxID=1129793 RepID=K6ZNZ8_9ALTE|nr:thioesterase family protein [Paraglaciecola polaris]GAC32022.1 acyl-CoA thioester hydrolase [Paraglaciecola polaris LMG 21857]|tara:strand:+ start:1967 stop:2416 length:450 start_codon:yes stop_codon:yes gene_type:complete
MLDFNYYFRVRYGECDMQSVVFNARYGDYVDITMTEYFRAFYGGFETLIQQGYDTQVVNLNISWKSSGRFDDVIRARVQVLKVGNTSFTCQVELTHQATNRLIANADITYVCVDAKTFAKTSIPQSLRDAFSNNGGTISINHAGDLAQN